MRYSDRERHQPLQRFQSSEASRGLGGSGDAVADRDCRRGVRQSDGREEVLPERRSGWQDAHLQRGREQLPIAVLRQLGVAQAFLPRVVDSRRV